MVCFDFIKNIFIAVLLKQTIGTFADTCSYTFVVPEREKTGAKQESQDFFVFDMFIH